VGTPWFFSVRFAAVAASESVGPVLAAEREARFRQWQRDVETLTQHVWDLHHQRAIWRQMRPALDRASTTDTTYLDHYARLYTERQLIAVRRLVDPDPRSNSLTRLLTGLADHPETMSRKRHLDLWELSDDPTDRRDQWRMQQAHEVFDRYADGDGDNLDPSAVRRDLDEWKRASASIKRVVDKRIAHLDDLPGDRPPPTATYNDLDSAIDTVGKMIVKYALLVTGRSIADLEPHIPGDWKRPFRGPLFDEA
jgi:hypothetical protein